MSDLSDLPIRGIERFRKRSETVVRERLIAVLID